jgi:hypothetical protein
MQALLSNAVLQALARNPASLKQQVEEHCKVHAAVVKAGLVPEASSSKTAAAAAPGQGTPEKQAQDGAATPAAAMKSPGKRPRIVPRVPLRGFKQLPAWWVGPCSRTNQRDLACAVTHHVAGITRFMH